MNYFNENDEPLTENIEQIISNDACLAYSGYDPSLNLAICEAMGRRPSQEDRVTYGILPNFGQLSFSEKNSLFQQTFITLQKQLGPLYPSTGSTAIANIIEPTKITTAWVGDSTSYLVLLDAKGDTAKIEWLNPNLHHPDPATAEGQRVFQTALKNHYALPYQDRPRFWRTGDGLALSRAIGDLYSESFGVSHEPEIRETHYQLPTRGHGFLLTACDGLTESMSLEDLEAFFKANYTSNLRELAKSLVQQALGVDEKNPAKWSWDNVSVMLVKLGETPPNLVTAIFDGHNGSAISEALRQSFLSTLHITAIKLGSGRQD
jgi:serine/threonine protein phosphatase PrpC